MAPFGWWHLPGVVTLAHPVIASDFSQPPALKKGWIMSPQCSPAPASSLCPGTRVLVQLSPQFHGRVAGLCGDFDGDASNDLRSRQGVLEPTAELAAHSWRLNPLCPEPADLPYPCTVRMGRK